MTVHGEVVLDGKAPAFENADLHVYLEEMTQNDVRAKVAGHLILRNVSAGGPRHRPLPFTFGEFSPDRGASYNIRAHVVLGVEKRIMKGDYVNVLRGDYLSLARHPVFDAPGKNRVRVEVRLIR